MATPVVAKPAPVPTAKDRRRPVAEVQFRLPIEIPGIELQVKRLVKGERVSLTDKMCPAIFFDPDLRCLFIGDYLYPLDGGTVMRMKLAKTA